MPVRVASDERRAGPVSLGGVAMKRRAGGGRGESPDSRQGSPALGCGGRFVDAAAPGDRRARVVPPVALVVPP
jgi:hypothetical protein